MLKTIAQTCTSKECKEYFKDYISKSSEAIVTPQKLNEKTGKYFCIYCGESPNKR